MPACLGASTEAITHIVENQSRFFIVCEILVPPRPFAGKPVDMRCHGVGIGITAECPGPLIIGHYENDVGPPRLPPPGQAKTAAQARVAAPAPNDFRKSRLLFMGRDCNRFRLS